MTSYNPIRRSPISTQGATVIERAGWQVAEKFTSPESEAAAVRQSVGLADLSTLGKVLIQGRAAPAALQAAFGTAPGGTGDVVEVPGGVLACLSADDWYLTTPTGVEARVLADLDAALKSAAPTVHVTDLTHGNGAVLLAGPKAGDVMPKVCGLDFHPRAFPNHHVMQSSVARLHTIIIRNDLPGGLLAYQLHVSRSEADYLWSTIADAASEFGGKPFGAAALAALSA